MLARSRSRHTRPRGKGHRRRLDDAGDARYGLSATRSGRLKVRQRGPSNPLPGRAGPVEVSSSRYGNAGDVGGSALKAVATDGLDGGQGADERRAPFTVEERVKHALSTLLTAGERYPTLSVERILSTAGVARSTFYAYFDDKHHVLREVGHEAVDSLVASVGGWSDIDATADRSDLRAVIARLVAVYREHAAVLAAITEAGPYETSARAEVRRMFAVGASWPTTLASSKHSAPSVRRSTPSSRSIGSSGCSRTASTGTWVARGPRTSTRTSRP